MTILTVAEAGGKLDELLNDVAQSHRVIQITGQQNSAVLVSEEDWRAIQETLCLAAIPGMNESIAEGMRTPIEECAKELDCSGPGS